MSHPFHLVFCDGACLGNPGPGGWGAVLGLATGEVVELAGREPHSTNNRMEITAVLEALRFLASREGEIKIFTDSRYVIKGVTEWIPGWKRRDWITATGTPVVNRDLWEILWVVWNDVKARVKVSLAYVPGHCGIPGNERADEIATSSAKQVPFTLYNGQAQSYLIPLEVPTETKGAAKKKSSGKALGYLSLIDGELRRHAAWSDCEKRVKGKAGAKFRKYTSAEEEREILKSWGLSPNGALA